MIVGAMIGTTLGQVVEQPDDYDLQPNERDLTALSRTPEPGWTLIDGRWRKPVSAWPPTPTGDDPDDDQPTS